MEAAMPDGGHRPRKLLVFGCGGQVGQALLRADLPRGFDVLGLGRAEADLTDASRLASVVETVRPDLVVNAGAYTAVDRAESEPDAAFACNRDGPGKLAGEEAIRERTDRHVIMRTAWVYSATGQNFVKTMLRLGDQRDELRIVADQTGCPTAAHEIARAIVVVAERLLADPGAAHYGTYHYCGRGATTWYGLAEAVCRLARPYRRTTPRLLPIATADYPTPARRPANSVLDCSRIERDYAVERPWWLGSLTAVIDELHRG